MRRTTSALLAAAAGLALAAPAVAQPASDGPSSSQVERQLSTAEDRLAELEAVAGRAVEDYNEARAALDAAEAELTATTEEAAEVAERIEVLRTTTDAIARQLYKGGGANLQFGSLLSAEGPIEAGSRYATVQRVLRTHRGDAQSLDAAQTRLAELERRDAELRDLAAEQAEELEARRAEVEATLAEQADEIAELEAALAQARDREEAARRAEEERRRAEEAEARAAEERAAARERAAETTTAAPSPSGGTTGTGTPTSSTTNDTGSSPAPAARGSAQVAVDTALAQVGKPYQWGGSGPNSFDCSGLTSYAWRAAGVTLPRTSRAQFSGTTRISRGELRPGDLVFFGSPIHHVAMYIGGGRVVEAARTGIPVRTSSTALGRGDIAGFGRV